MLQYIYSFQLEFSKEMQQNMDISTFGSKFRLYDGKHVTCEYNTLLSVCRPLTLDTPTIAQIRNESVF